MHVAFDSVVLLICVQDAVDSWGRHQHNAVHRGKKSIPPETPLQAVSPILPPERASVETLLWPPQQSSPLHFTVVIPPKRFLPPNRA